MKNYSSNTLMRKDWIDFSRGILMLCVFIYHSEVYFGSGHSWSWIFAPFFLIGFFFISGYLFTNDINNISLKKKTKQIFNGLIVPYFCFSFLFVIPKMLFYGFAIKEMIADIFLFRASWFVVCIGVLQFIYALILSKKPSYNKVLFLTSILFFFGYIGVVFYRNFPDSCSNVFLLQSSLLPNRLPFCLNQALVVTPFFAGGMIYRQYENRLSLHSLFALCILIIFYLTCVSLDHIYLDSDITLSMDVIKNLPLSYFYALLGTIIIIEISKRIRTMKMINYIGKYSLIFYFLNGISLQFVSAVCRYLNINNADYLNQILVAFLACLLAFPAVWFINKYLPLLAGKYKIIS